VLNSVQLVCIIYNTGWRSSDLRFYTGFEGVRRFYTLIQGTEGPNRSKFGKIRFVRSVYILNFVFSYDIVACALHVLLFIT
jgi:hypothetical protein